MGRGKQQLAFQLWKWTQVDAVLPGLILRESSKYEDGFQMPGSEMFTECLPCARDCAKQLIGNISLDPQSSPIIQVLYYQTLPINWDLARGRNLPSCTAGKEAKPWLKLSFQQLLHTTERERSTKVVGITGKKPLNQTREWGKAPQRKWGCNEI